MITFSFLCWHSTKPLLPLIFSVKDIVRSSNSIYITLVARTQPTWQRDSFLSTKITSKCTSVSMKHWKWYTVWVKLALTPTQINKNRTSDRRTVNKQPICLFSNYSWASLPYKHSSSMVSFEYLLYIYSIEKVGFCDFCKGYFTYMHKWWKNRDEKQGQCDMWAQFPLTSDTAGVDWNAN